MEVKYYLRGCNPQTGEFVRHMGPFNTQEEAEKAKSLQSPQLKYEVEKGKTEKKEDEDLDDDAYIIIPKKFKYALTEYLSRHSWANSKKNRRMVLDEIVHACKKENLGDENDVETYEHLAEALEGPIEVSEESLSAIAKVLDRPEVFLTTPAYTTMTNCPPINYQMHLKCPACALDSVYVYDILCSQGNKEWSLSNGSLSENDIDEFFPYLIINISCECTRCEFKFIQTLEPWHDEKHSSYYSRIVPDND